jgi:predicted nucleic acid-binding protein
MTTVFAVDANCMIAAISAWDKRHAEASAEIKVRLARGEGMSISVQALNETYSLLTRLPAPYRLSPADAWKLLELTFLARGSVFALDAPAHVGLLQELANQDLGGGRTYDAIIGECARQAGATTLLTFNRRHFDPPPDGVTIVEPSA